MSFTSADGIIDLIERLLYLSWPYGEEQDKIEIPFRRMSYKEALTYYGTDKPDTRFDMQVSATLSLFAFATFSLLFTLLYMHN